MSNPRPKAGRLAFLGSVLVSLLATTIVTVLALALPVSKSGALFAESGPIEQASPWLWLALALWIPLVFRKPTLEVAAGMVVAIASAAREWDWHLKFTEYSVLKPPFYYRSEHTTVFDGVEHVIRVGLPERLIAGAIVLVVLAAAVVLFARLIHLRPWKRPWAWWVFALGFAFLMLVLTKVVDRTPAILRDDLRLVDLDTYPSVRMVFYAVEEGLELLLPVFFGAYALALARWHAGRKHFHGPAKN